MQRAPAERRIGLAAAVQGYARAVQDIGRMMEQGLPALEYQKTAMSRAAHVLDGVQQNAGHDLDSAFARAPGLVSEAASAQTSRAIQALQLEAELRTNPEMRADRFVQAWRQLSARRDRLHGWQNEEVRHQVEGRMKSMAAGIEKDPAMGSALSRRAAQLLGRQWALEWTPGSSGGDIGHELSDRARARSLSLQLAAWLDRDRERGIGL